MWFKKPHLQSQKSIGTLQIGSTEFETKTMYRSGKSIILTPLSTFGHTKHSHLLTKSESPKQKRLKSSLIQKEAVIQKIWRYSCGFIKCSGKKKTTHYDLALFLSLSRKKLGTLIDIAVKLFVHSEMNDQSEEALNVLKQWNLLWSPSYFMCDYSESKLKYLPSKQLSLITPSTCVFSTGKQSWDRWVKNHQHGLTNNKVHC